MSLFDDTMRCLICKRRIQAYGHYNHSMYHVRRGEALQSLDPLTIKYGIRGMPYVFTVKEQAGDEGKPLP